MITRAEMVMGVSNLVSLLRANTDALPEMPPAVREVLSLAPREVMLVIAHELDGAIGHNDSQLVEGLSALVARLRGIRVGADPKPAAFLADPDVDFVDPLDRLGEYAATDVHKLNMALVLAHLVGIGERKPSRRLRAGDDQDVAVINLSSSRGRLRTAVLSVVDGSVKSSFEGTTLWRHESMAWHATVQLDAQSQAKRVEQCLGFCAKHSTAIARATRSDDRGFQALSKAIRSTHDLRTGFFASPGLTSLAADLGLGGQGFPYMT